MKRRRPRRPAWRAGGWAPSPRTRASGSREAARPGRRARARHRVARPPDEDQRGLLLVVDRGVVVAVRGSAEDHPGLGARPGDRGRDRAVTKRRSTANATGRGSLGNTSEPASSTASPPSRRRLATSTHANPGQPGPSEARRSRFARPVARPQRRPRPSCRRAPPPPPPPTRGSRGDSTSQGRDGHVATRARPWMAARAFLMPSSAAPGRRACPSRRPATGCPRRAPSPSPAAG